MEMALNENRNCLSWWFPRIYDAGLPVPKTEIFRIPEPCTKAIWALFDGKLSEEGSHAIGTFAETLGTACDRMGYPCFMRTGQFSGKHNWKKTCFIPDRKCIAQHICDLAEMSEMCGMFGELPWNVWCVREMLPTTPVVELPAYGGFPLCREFRLFVRDGEVQCLHPYWPLDSIREGFPGKKPPSYIGSTAGIYENLCVVSANDVDALRDLATRAGKAVGGYWSVDLLSTTRGWYLTDMAIGDRSFHWPDCPNKGGV